MRTPFVAVTLLLFVGLHQPKLTREAATQVADTLNPNMLKPEHAETGYAESECSPVNYLGISAFLVGSWKCDVLVKKQPDGTPVHLAADWTGHYILDGVCDRRSVQYARPAGGSDHVGDEFPVV